MNVLAALLLSITIPGIQSARPARTPVDTVKAHSARKGGKWYFAETGHAVYCMGPVMYVEDVQGGLQRVATFCQGDKSMVPLKD
jgi:hypothetical protein